MSADLMIMIILLIHSTVYFSNTDYSVCVGLLRNGCAYFDDVIENIRSFDHGYFFVRNCEISMAKSKVMLIIRWILYINNTRYFIKK